jgi:hypothetical protein
MSPASEPTSILIGCSVLQAEIEAVVAQRWPGMQTRFLDSMLHMNPDRLEAALRDEMDGASGEAVRLLIAYGDCCAGMTLLEQRPRVARVPARNCCELLLGRDEYRRLSREGAFFLLPEWTHRWREVFEQRLGLSGPTAADFMRDLQSRLIYLDTGLAPVPGETLAECSRFCGLPVEVRTVTLDQLAGALSEAIDRLTPAGGGA